MVGSKPLQSPADLLDPRRKQAPDPQVGHQSEEAAAYGYCVFGEVTAGILTTAGHLLFTADNSGNLMALDPENGKTLWHAQAGGHLVSSPMTYELDGKQYLLTAVQDLVLVWKLTGD